MTRYRCPHCGFETDHLLVYLIHLDRHEGERRTPVMTFSFSLSETRART